MKYILLILCGFILTACSYAGPYVTNISRAQDGKFTVEKCMIRYNPFGNTISSENCINQVI